MSRIPFNLSKMRAARFDGSPRYNLDKAHDMLLGSTPAESVSDEDVAKALRATCNIAEYAKGAAQVAPGERPPDGSRPVAVMQKIGKLGRIPNLSSVGKWEGRMRRVQFGPTGTAAQTITLGWDAVQRWPILVPDTVDLPWPYWETVKNRVHVDDLSDRARKWARNEETEQLEVTVKPIKTPVFNYVDLGDVPGTENLPTSYTEYFQRESAKTGVFKGFGRQQLILILNRLTDAKPSTYFEKKEPVDIRIEIAKLLGPDAVHALDEEIYGTETEQAAG